MAQQSEEPGHFTKETEGKTGTIFTEEDARKAHHLATADPERDGVMTGYDHEVKYGLERADVTKELWRGAGVHESENRALRPGEDGYENLAGSAGAAEKAGEGITVSTGEPVDAPPSEQ